MLKLVAAGVLALSIVTADAALGQPVDYNDRAAWTNWALNCQGCHRPNGFGTPGGAPPLRGVVARFLTVEGGRAYLTRVPGVATAPLGDQDLADVLNFVLRHFDGGRLPPDFKPYTAAEIAAGRQSLLRTDAATTRQRLIARMAGAHQ
ncbi:c-type cytochrome [Caulobacter sp. KR2-114]|uniref:c-type cytochrome n=1 Tax=Caulobacter sp. KR2-114 TaxID=3400912 RepID=UPI003C0AF7BE